MGILPPDELRKHLETQPPRTSEEMLAQARKLRELQEKDSRKESGKSALSPSGPELDDDFKRRIEATNAKIQEAARRGIPVHDLIPVR